MAQVPVNPEARSFLAAVHEAENHPALVHVAAAAPAPDENKGYIFISRFGKFPGVSYRSFDFSASFSFMLAFFHPLCLGTFLVCEFQACVTSLCVPLVVCLCGKFIFSRQILFPGGLGDQFFFFFLGGVPLPLNRVLGVFVWRFACVIIFITAV